MASLMEIDADEGDNALDAVLGAFLGAVPEATGVVVAGATGRPIASRLPAERIQLIAATAMAKLVSWAGEAVAANLHLSGMVTITIDGPSWKVIVAPTPSHAAAVVVTLEGSADSSNIELALPGLLRAVDESLEGLPPA